MDCTASALAYWRACLAALVPSVGARHAGRCSRRGRCVRNVLLPRCILLWLWLWWRVQEKISDSHEPMREPDDASSGNIHCTACITAERC